MLDVGSMLLAIVKDQAWFYTLVLARVAGMAWTAPALSTSGIGWRIRLGLVAMVTMVVAPAASVGMTRPPDLASLAQIVPMEAGVGALMGLTASLIVAGARQAGEIVGLQVGLSPAALLDPDAGDEMNPLGHLYGLIAMGSFLAMDGPITLLGSLVESYRAIPSGGLALSIDTIDLAFSRIGWALSLAVRAAAPPSLAMIVAGVAIGLLGRAAPSLQMMSLALPIRVGVGLVLVFLSLMALAAMLTGTWGEIL